MILPFTSEALKLTQELSGNELSEALTKILFAVCGLDFGMRFNHLDDRSLETLDNLWHHLCYSLTKY